MDDQTNSTSRIVAKWAIVIILTAGGVFLAWQLRDVILLLFLSLVLSSLMRKPAQILARLRVPTSLATPLSFLLVFAVLGGILWFAMPRVASDAQNLASATANAYDKARFSLLTGGELTRAVLRRLPSPAELGLVQGAVSDGTKTAQMALDAGMALLLLLSQGLVVFFLSLYWTADRLRFERLAMAFISPDKRDSARAAWREFESGLGRYLFSEASQSLLLGGALTAGFLIIGMPHPFLMAFWAALAWAMPLLGAPIALAPIAIVGFMLGGPLVGVMAVALSLAVFAFMEFVIERKLYPRERYGGVLALVVTLVMISVFGLLGFVIAPPLTTAIQMLINSWMRPTTVAQPDPELEEEPWRAYLRETREIFAQIKNPSPRTQNLLARLEALAQEV